MYLIKTYDFDGYDQGGPRNLWYLCYEDSDYVEDDSDDILVKTIKSTIPTFKNTVFVSLFSPQEKYIKEIVDEFTLDNFFMGRQTVDIPPCKYNELSPELRSKLRGLRINLHTLWKFRKMLRDYQKYSCELMDCSSLYDDIANIKDQKERYKAFDKVTKEKVQDKECEYLEKIIRFFVENKDRWWD